MKIDTDDLAKVAKNLAQDVSPQDVAKFVQKTSTGGIDDALSWAAKEVIKDTTGVNLNCPIRKRKTMFERILSTFVTLLTVGAFLFTIGLFIYIFSQAF